MAVPKAMQEKYEEISSIINPFCDNYLGEEYKQLCNKALEKLCRKRPSPLLSGRAKTWAAGIIYAVGQANFIFDRSQEPHMTADELTEPLGVAKSTAASKAADIKKMLDLDFTNAEWILPSKQGDNPFVWQISVNGFLMDARVLPVEVQEEAYRLGLIPYVPGENK